MVTIPFYDYDYNYGGRHKLRPSRSPPLHLYTAKLTLFSPTRNSNYGGAREQKNQFTPLHRSRKYDIISATLTK